MAVVDPYAPCPCGSGQKFKWCCQKVEAFAEKAERLARSGQIDAALAALDDGLRKVPDNPWLLVRKALIHERRDQPEAARPLLERVLARQSGHVGAQALLVRVVVEIEGPVAGAAQLQRALSAVEPEARGSLGPLVQLVGLLLSRTDHVPSALAHIDLADAMGLGEDPVTVSTFRMLEGDPAISSWLKNPYEPSPPPDSLSDDHRARFAEAVQWAEEGLWQSAASAFDVLSVDAGGAEVDRNLGLCRLWMADEAGAAQALRRSIGWSGLTAEAVDLEALCQLVAPPDPDDLVEQVHLSWPLRDRESLLKTLTVRDNIVFEGRGPMDPDDPNSSEVEQFALLDRPRPAPRVVPGRPEDLALVQGRVLVGQEHAILDAFDDGRLDALSDRFREVAGATIAPAHPKTKVMAKASRSALAMQPEWIVPEGVDRRALAGVHRLERARVVREVWLKTPMPYLGGRTPEQAARAGDAQVPLRAAVCQLEITRQFWRDGVDFAALRESLGIGPEPEIDPATVDVMALHLARLHRVPADLLDDDRLVALFFRAKSYVLPLAMERAALALVERPAVLEREDVDRFTIFADLANLAVSRDAVAEGFAWADRGRDTEPSAQRARNAARWDLLGVRLRSRTEAPESWVPLLAVVLERYSEDQAASQTIMANLLDMGLVQMVPSPDKPDDVLLDSRPLQALLMEYGPKVTTAAGGLGVSAARPEIWTPGGAGGGSGGLWTPGGEAAPGAGGEKPKLIFPGR